MTDPTNLRVSPKKCGAKGGRPVERTPTANPPFAFTVKFAGATPDPNGQTGLVGARPPGRPHADAPFATKIPRIGLHAPNGDNEYGYEHDVCVNGAKVDPSITMDM